MTEEGWGWVAEVPRLRFAPLGMTEEGVGGSAAEVPRLRCAPLLMTEEGWGWVAEVPPLRFAPLGMTEEGGWELKESWSWKGDAARSPQAHLLTNFRLAELMQ
jgi:hypothetical protein